MRAQNLKQNPNPRQPKGSQKITSGIYLPKGKSPNGSQRFPRWTRSKGPWSAPRGSYPDAGRGVTMSQTLFFSFPKRLLEVGSSGQQEQREKKEFPKASGPSAATGVALAFRPLFQEFQHPRWPVRSAQHPAPPCGRKLSDLASEKSAPPLPSPQGRLAWRETLECLIKLRALRGHLPTGRSWMSSPNLLPKFSFCLPVLNSEMERQSFG